jgi:hypothetical protein
MRASVIENASNVIATNGEVDADRSLTHEVLLRDAGEVLGDAAMCLIRSRSCRHNLFTLACPGRIRGSSSRRRDAGELSVLETPTAPLPSERIATVRHRRIGAEPEPRSLRLVTVAMLHPSSPRPRIRHRYRYMRLADAGAADQDGVTP